jgi:hypothetical protein
VSTALAPVNTQAQTGNTGNNPYLNWVTAATGAVTQQNGVLTAEGTTATALNGSTEAKNRRQIVQLYTVLLNRGPTITELNTYASQMASGTTATQVVTSILATSEALAIYPATGQTNAQFLAAMYTTSIGHAADTLESSQWTTFAASSKAAGVVSMANWLATYAGNDAQAQAIQSQMTLNAKTQVNLAPLGAAMSAWYDTLDDTMMDAQRITATLANRNTLVLSA